MIGLPPADPEEHIAVITLEDVFGPVHFWLLPYIRPSMVKNVIGTEENGSSFSYAETLKRMLARENVDPQERNVIVSHQFYLPAGKKAENVERMDSEIRTVGNIDEVPASVLAPFDYAALGHIHKPMEAGGRTVRYCGTPLACSVSEAGQQKGIIVVEMGAKKPAADAAGAADASPETEISTRVIPLKPLREVRIVRGTLEEVLSAPSGDYVTVILTDDAGLDAFDAREKLVEAFPYLLEIRREVIRGADYAAEYTEEAALDPFELCCAFLKDLDEGEQELLRDVINRVQEVQG